MAWSRSRAGWPGRSTTSTCSLCLPSRLPGSDAAEPTMGLAIEQERFGPADYRRFERRLDDCLTALGRLLDRPGFGAGPATVGAELELFLVDGQGRALPRNQEVRAETADPRVVLEIDRFNLELNLTPAPLAGRPFAAMASELDQALGIVRRAAAWHGGRVVMVGILPTLAPEDLQLAALSDAPRYRALSTTACGGCARSRSGSGSTGPTRWSWPPTTSASRGPTPPSRSTCGSTRTSSPTTSTPPSWPPARSWPWPATPPPSSATGSGRRPGWPCSSRRSATPTPPG